MRSNIHWIEVVAICRKALVNGGYSALSPTPLAAHIGGMANPPEPRNKPPKKAKDPARPTRAKAAREALPEIAPALADLLNPAINRGEAGVGSQTGLKAPPSGLQPPPDNSRDRRADFAAAHRARASTPEGPSERPQAGYVGKSPLRDGKTPVGPGEIDPDLARALGLVDEEVEDSSRLDTSGASAGNLDLQDALRLPRVLPLPGEGDASGVAATAQALEVLLREGRPEFREQPWLPHRPPRPEKSEAGSVSSSNRISLRRATSPRRSPN